MLLAETWAYCTMEIAILCQQDPHTTLSVVNTTVLSWRLIKKGHGDVDAGQGTLLLGIVLVVASLMESSKRVREQSATGENSRVPNCSLNHVSSCTYKLLDVSVTSTSHDALILVVRICLSPHTDSLRRRFR